MYSKIQLLCCSLLLAVSAFAQTFSYTPQKPKAGDKVTFTYDLSRSKIKNADKDKMDIGVMWINVAENKYPIIEPAYTVKGTVISGSFSVPEKANLLAIRITDGSGKQDNNGGEGFTIAVHDASGNPVSGVLSAKARLLSSGMGNALLGTETTDQRNLELMEAAWKGDPASRGVQLNSYISILTKLKKNEAEPAILQLLEEAEKTPGLSMQDLSIVASQYTRMKKADKATAVNNLIKERFPQELQKRNESTALSIINDFGKRYEAIQAFVKKNPAQNERDKAQYNAMFNMLANQYANNKQGVDISKLELYASALDDESKYGLYNNLAWQWAHDKDTMYAQAEILSAKAVAWARAESKKPTGIEQNFTSNKMLASQRKYSLGMYADTYAEIQRKLRNDAGAYYAAEEACNANGWAEAEYNDRYIIAAEKFLSNEAFVQKAGKLAEDGKLGKDGKAALERALMQQLGDANSVKAYMARINNAAFDQTKAEYAKNLIDEAAPEFALKNMEGKTVSLKELKGKTVVIDFWATWCGPCKVSFPGMQQTLNKYKDRSDVVFLFVDTWERQPTPEQRKKEVTAFIEQNKYTFNVLYDEKDAQDNFEVVSKYKVDGIPTKFVINKDGRIRFKSVGGNANADKIVNEMTAMIELAEGGK